MWFMRIFLKSKNTRRMIIYLFSVKLLNFVHHFRWRRPHRCPHCMSHTHAVIMCVVMMVQLTLGCLMAVEYPSGCDEAERIVSAVNGCHEGVHTYCRDGENQVYQQLGCDGNCQNCNGELNVAASCSNSSIGKRFLMCTSSLCVTDLSPQQTVNTALVAVVVSGIFIIILIAFVIARYLVSSTRRDMAIASPTGGRLSNVFSHSISHVHDNTEMSCASSLDKESLENETCENNMTCGSVYNDADTVTCVTED